MSQPDSFVSIGTPFEVPDEDDEYVRKKPVPVHEQVVLDERGRRRFHGAFTGGFSAGYFNSVGTEEGWAPKTFSSTKDERAGKYQQRPEDFMDEEDLGEFGIAPKRVSTRQDFTHPEQQHAANVREETRKNVFEAHHHAVIPGLAPLHDLIVPGSQTIGARLLKKMGWKEGQGVGPKQRHGDKDLDNKVYHSVQTKGESSSTTVDSLSKWAFSPRDVDIADLPPLVGRHGLGYKAMDSSRTSVLQTKMRSNPSSNLRISGQAFGVGAYEVDDADVYDVDDMTSYDQTMGASDHADPFFGWSGSHDQHLDGGHSLSAFAKAKRPQPARKTYHAPDLPRDFKPYHHFQSAARKSAAEIGLVEKSMGASTRGQLLGENRLQDMSVMSLLSEADCARLAQAKKHQQPPAAGAAGAPRGGPGSTAAESAAARQSTPSAHSFSQTTSGLQSSATAGAGLASRFQTLTTPAGPSHFKPYVSNPDKQQRYEVFTSGQPYAKHPDMLEWEEQREREEFARAAQLYRPLGGIMASRFTPATGKDEEPEASKETVLADHVTDPTDQVSAARAKMFGRLTRTTLDWHPDRLLCKRFNVPDPYPNSHIIGLRTESVNRKANFMNMDFMSTQQMPPAAAAALSFESSNEPTAAQTALEDSENVSSFMPVSKSSEALAVPPGGGVSFQISKEPMKAMPRPALTGPLAVLNKPKSTSSAPPQGQPSTPTITSSSIPTSRPQPGRATGQQAKAGNGSTPVLAEEVMEAEGVSSVAGAADTADPEPERPGIDFFKAIFASEDEGDSGNMEDSSDESDKAEADTAPPDKGLDNAGSVTANGDAPTMTTSLSGSRLRHAFVPRSQRHQNADSADEDEFGPALPPSNPPGMPTATAGTGQTISASAPLPEQLGDKSHRDKKHKKKNKKKEKEKKSKKSKSKKSHREHRRRQDSYSESSSDDERRGGTARYGGDGGDGGGGSTTRESGRQLNTSLPASQRPLAADFM